MSLLVLPKTVKIFLLLLIDQDHTEAQGREHTQEKTIVYSSFGLPRLLKGAGKRAYIEKKVTHPVKINK